ncbi:MAG: M48 family metalloprotease [Candidatus Melainabacteria bacterium]|nr:M48 family metalloprotease [Candidatus Melainabacteria bacterium]
MNRSSRINLSLTGLFGTLASQKQLLLALCIVGSFSLWIPLPVGAANNQAWQVLKPVGSSSRQATTPAWPSPHTGYAQVHQAPQSHTAILQRLIQSNQLPKDLVQSITLEDSPELNAYTNGQKIVITTKLWQQLHTSDQRAFIVGHELSHIVLSHLEKTQRRRVGLALLDRFVLQRYAPEGGLGYTAGNIGLGLIDKKFSRNLEYQADDLGMQLMTKAGYHPKGALEAFQVLENGRRNGSPPEFLLTHPLSRSRVEALANKYKLR